VRVYEWKARLVGGDGDGSGAFVGFPWDPKAEFGKANLVPIRAEFDGEPYRGVIANMGEGPCLIVLKEIRAKIGKNVGDEVSIRLWHDTEPRVIEPPADLAEAMGTVPAARAYWDKLAPSHRKQYVQWLESAKRPETRTARLAKAVALLAEGKNWK